MTKRTDEASDQAETEIVPEVMSDASLRRANVANVPAQRSAMPDSLSEDQLRTLSFADLDTASAIEASEFGTGFDVDPNKDALLGVHFIVFDAQFHQGDFGPFVSLALITEDGRKLIINDGSTGIYQQMVSIMNAKLAANDKNPIRFRKGLSKSSYQRKDIDGNPMWLVDKQGNNLTDEAGNPRPAMGTTYRLNY